MNLNGDFVVVVPCFSLPKTEPRPRTVRVVFCYCAVSLASWIDFEKVCKILKGV